MDRSHLKPTTAATRPTINKNNDSAGTLYGSVQLKKTNVTNISATQRSERSSLPCKSDFDKNDGKNVHEVVTMKTSVGANCARKGSDFRDKITVSDKGTGKASEAVKSKKSGITKESHARKKAVEKSSSIDTFDSVKHLKAEKARRYPKNNDMKDPTSPLNESKKLGKVKHSESIFDEIETANQDSADWLAGVLSKVNGNTGDLKKQAIALHERIQAAGGRPAQRRLSVSDNDLVTQLTKAAMNDASVTEICIIGDCRFKNIKPDIVVGFAESIRTNLNLRKLVICKVGLGNDFLSALADSIRTNFMLEHVDLSDNTFTNDGLVDFCLGMADNESLKYVNLQGQHSPIFSLRENLVVEALTENEYVQGLRVEFQNAKCSKKIEKMLKRNNATPKTISDYGMKLLNLLANEAAIANKRIAERKKEAIAKEINENDMPLLYELSVRAAKYKLPYESASQISTTTLSKAVEPIKVTTSLAKISANILTTDGSFLTNEFISQYLHRDKADESLTFDFSNQIKLFKRFLITDPARSVIVKKFVDAVVDNPHAGDITHINMVNTMVGNDLLVYLSERCLDDSSLLPNLHLLNLEINFISGTGVIALAKCIGNPCTWKYLQAVKLDNQKQLISSEAEDELARALCVNRSVVKLSLRVGNLFERRRINNYISRNNDFLRQARHWHAVQTGTVKERTRNKMEKMFDSIAANDPNTRAVVIVADPLFLTLRPDEVIKAAKSFATNKYVDTIKMSGLRLNDKFAVEMARSIESNTSIKKLDLENNMIGGNGVMAIISSLSKNCAITELLLCYQSSTISSTDEERLPEFIANNSVIAKLNVNIRSNMAKDKVDRKLRQNQELKRSQIPKKPPSGIRNRVQQLFDSVAANDPTITEVKVVCDLVFLSMNPAEILKTAESFRENTRVKIVKMSGLRLDDKWTVALSKTLETNTTIEKIDLESNSIGSEGFLALITSLSKNSTTTELMLRHQLKPMATSFEELIPGLIAHNDKILKLSMDIRSVNVRSNVDTTLRRNQELRRKNRHMQ